LIKKQGAVVELGSHGALLRDPTGHYSTLVKLQLQVPRRL
jgi:ABC-type multidrug transport system fused ATPase/permease subunit